MFHLLWHTKLGDRLPVVFRLTLIFVHWLFYKWKIIFWQNHIAFIKILSLFAKKHHPGKYSSAAFSPSILQHKGTTGQVAYKLLPGVKVVAEISHPLGPHSSVFFFRIYHLNFLSGFWGTICIPKILKKKLNLQIHLKPPLLTIQRSKDGTIPYFK